MLAVHRMRMKVLLRCATVFVGSCSQALACTLCHSNTAEQVRAAVLTDFWRNVGVSLIPFGIMLAIAALIHGREARGARHE